MWEFKHEYDLITGVMKLTFKEKPKECEDIFNFFNLLCVMTDIGEDIYRIEGIGLPYYICALTLRTYLELQSDILQGAYYSAGRTLRWLYELNTAGSAACLNPSLLDNEYVSKKFDIEEFEKWLERYDNRQAQLDRNKIFDFLGLPKNDLEFLYSNLCKYIHVSKISFDKKLDWPKLQFIPDKFNEIFDALTKTLDLILWLESKIDLLYNGGTQKVLKNYLLDKDGLNKYIPMTIKLIADL